MKFDYSLQHNAVPEWSANYIAYSNLKTLIYTLEKTSVYDGNASASASASASADPESAGLISHSESNPEVIFSSALDDEKDKINRFYIQQEAKIYASLDQLIRKHAEYAGHVAHQEFTDDKSDDGPELKGWHDSAQRRRRHLQNPFLSQDHGEDVEKVAIADEDVRSEMASIRSRRDSLAAIHSQGPTTLNPWDLNEDNMYNTYYDQRLHLKKLSTAIYVALCELRSYQQLNRTGFAKALKKFDKTMGTDLKSHYLAALDSTTYIFSAEIEQRLDGRVNEAVDIYATLATSGDINQAKAELRLHLREHIVWERNTVWRDMVALEKQMDNVRVNTSHKVIQLQGETPTVLLDPKRDFVQVWRVRVPKYLLGMKMAKILLAVVIFAVLGSVKTLNDPVQGRALAVLAVASYLWATETIPLFATSFLVPLLCVTMRIVRGTDGQPLTAMAAGDWVLATMWNNVIMMLLGGFTLASALSKYNIAKVIATGMLSQVGTNPNIILGAMMFLSWFLSMWISNVASPVLMFSIAEPLLRTMPSGSRFSKAIILGIALSANIGGMASPISSPQNIIAISYMNPPPSWGLWFEVAIPVCIFSLFCVWTFLIVTLQPGKTIIKPIKFQKEHFTLKHWYIVVVTVGTIILWCLTTQLQNHLSNNGIVAIIPIMFFFGGGILTGDDFNGFLWTIIGLGMGGIALGKALTSSGLLATIAMAIERKINGMSVFGVLTVFGALVLVVATFVSHTVAALVILPLVQQIGKAMPGDKSNILVLSSALLCSCAMGLPTSGFPNVTAICMRDREMKPYVTVSNFITRGVPSSAFCYAVVISLGYFIMKSASV